MLKGIARSAVPNKRNRLPITSSIMRQLQSVWARKANTFEARMLWAACCLGYFGFLRSGEFTLQDSKSPPAILLSDVSVDSHSAPSMCCVSLRRSKTDPTGKGVCIFLGRTNAPLCPVVALLNYLAVRSERDGPLFVFQDGTPLLRDRFIREVKEALVIAGVDSKSYSGHSFRIGATTAAAKAGVPAFTIKMLGRWESEAYQLYVRTPRETLAAISSKIAQ